MAEAQFKVFRGEEAKGELFEFTVEVTEGMVVLDAVQQIQSRHANDLAVRWNCRAGKCGSCSAEVNGKPRLMCMTRMDELSLDVPVLIEPMRGFPHMKDLVTDVSRNYEINKKIRPLTPKPRETAIGTRNWACRDRSNIKGVKPTNVVTDVSMIGRKRRPPASLAACAREQPARTRRLI